MLFLLSIDTHRHPSPRTDTLSSHLSLGIVTRVHLELRANNVLVYRVGAGSPKVGLLVHPE